jgi:hypothetical protein
MKKDRKNAAVSSAGHTDLKKAEACEPGGLQWLSRW